MDLGAGLDRNVTLERSAGSVLEKEENEEEKCQSIVERYQGRAKEKKKATRGWDRREGDNNAGRETAAFRRRGMNESRTVNNVSGKKKEYSRDNKCEFFSANVLQERRWCLVSAFKYFLFFGGRTWAVEQRHPSRNPPTTVGI